MSNINAFYDIMNNFNSEDEDEINDEEYNNNNNKKLKHKSTSSLTENINDKIKEKLTNEENEEESNENKKSSRRDQFGYFINNEEDDDSEDSNSNNKEKEESNNNQNFNENENEIKSDEENNIKNNEDINSDNNKKANMEDKENNENKQDLNLENNDNNKDEDLYEPKSIENENEEQNDLINELYSNKSIKHENLDSIEGEGFRMNSFRPNPVPGSPKFTKRETLNNNEIKNTEDINNNNLNNFTETIETKIEGESPDINLEKENPINKNDFNPIYTHSSNIISLGNLPNKENIITSESIEKMKNDRNKIEENSKNEEEKEEEAFLQREELKRQKYKEDLILNNKEDDEKGKENVTEDEEDSQTQVVSKLKLQENLENLEFFRNKKEKLREEVTEEDEEEKHKINNFKKKNSKNEIDDIKAKDISIKLSQRYEKNESERLPKKNNTNNKNKIVVTTSKKNNQKNLINIPFSRNEKYNSPKNKYIKYNNNTTDNKKIPISSIKKNTSFKMNSNYNSNLSKKSSLKNKNDLESIKKNLYNPKYDVKSKLYEPINSKNLNYTPEKYSFLPNISQKSREICEKKDNKRPTTPIGVLLYEDANNKKEKLNQICLTENNLIISNANSKKINNNSYNMAIDRINKRIDNAIKKYSKNGKISILGLTQCLFELNVITELIKIKDNIQDVNNDLDFVELQSIIESINGKDFKKLEEVEFIEQSWFLVNPAQTKYINNMILSEILKILFSSNNNIKDLSNSIKKTFEKYNINKNEENENEEENNLYSSPLRNKQYNTNELWPLTKFIKIFLKLKTNLKAYKDNDYQKGDIYNNIIKERDKDLTFQPDISGNTLFYKYSKYNYNRENSGIRIPLINNTTNNSPSKQKVDFEKVYERFMAEKQLHEKTLERLREIKKEKEIKMCTNVPKINKYIPPNSVKTSFKIKNKTIDSGNSPILQKNNSSFDIKLPIFKKLYNLKKDYHEKNNNNVVLDKNCTFKPNITVDTDILNKTFSNMKSMKKPKGFNEYVKRNRGILEKKENDKKMEEDKKYGKNYEKIQKMKLKPFNITDLNGNGHKKKKINIPFPSSNSNKNLEQINNNNKPVNNYDNEKIENIIDDVYITIDIKIPNGLLKPLKIYNKNYNETLEIVNNFCKIYSINDENKRIILKKVLQYKNAFFGRNLMENKDGFIFNEDLETITNTNSNNSNH